MAESLDVLVAQLQAALGSKVTCGSITLNLNENRVQSVKTETHQRIGKAEPSIEQYREEQRAARLVQRPQDPKLTHILQSMGPPMALRGPQTDVKVLDAPEKQTQT